MLLPRIFKPCRAALQSSRSSCSASYLSQPSLDVLRSSRATSSPILTFVRNASHQAQGRANGPKNGAGKRLGAKKTGEEYVIPGNIIFRQRGTLWFPGENCAMGRDHTIYATQPGYVKYYRDPETHPKRRYIGVVFQRNWALPSPVNAARKRRLGMLAVKTEVAAEVEDAQEVTSGVVQVPAKKKKKMKGELPDNPGLRPDYSYRVGNWEIGKVADNLGQKIRTFVKGNRFLAWRKATQRKARNAEKRGMMKGQRKKK